MRFSDIQDFGCLVEGALPSVDFTGVQCDSRRVRPGDVFVVIVGNHDDGVRYVESAIARGAVAIVSETPISGVSVPVVIVRTIRRALAILADTVYGKPSRRLALYGVTGTNGKTTTAWVLHAMLEAVEIPAGLLTTVAVAYGERLLPATRTTPDACTLQATLADMLATGCRAAVMEVSSHAIDQCRVDATHFSGGIFTNLSQDHLDYHKTMDAYFEVKTRFFRALASEHPGAPAVCFLDHAYGVAMADRLRALPLDVITCGFGADAPVRATDCVVSARGNTFTLHLPDGFSERLTCALAGRYNIANVLCAAAMAWRVGVAGTKIAAVIRSLEPRWGRLERVSCACPADVFVDYAHTDDALTNVLATLREMTHGRIIVVFGCGGDRDRAKRPLMGAACASGADRLVVTSDNPRSEAPDEIIAEIVAGIPEGTNYVVEPDRATAIHRALREAVAGDVVLVAGKGHETYQEIDGRIIPFDDRMTVKNYSL